ncbi:ABC transporter permease [Brachyspira aalborgi]|uniref:ABC transporter permease n=1 Tax=Brachyspira aalborgi TaxID=29522 RepID=A0A5C8F6M8_9SPIR|nr:ABC transporter permease [Brachyspira aalborgi]TXJ45328.1 ABC transporter permease [Brachyspira aalborgi]
MKKIFKQQEFFIFIILLVISAIITIINPKFLSIGNIFSILKSTTVLGILSIGVLLVIILGGIDVSFPSIASFSMYTSSLIVLNTMPNANIIFIFIIAMIIGALCGFINGFLIAKYDFPAMVVTLGTSGALLGFMYTFIGTRINHRLSFSLIEFGKTTIFNMFSGGVIVGLPLGYIIYILIALIVSFLLRYTMFGRSIYAIGGDQVSAIRIGLKVRNTKIIVYMFVGILAGVAGVIHSSYLRMSNPFELYGTELLVIASVILGGATIGGGRGTVIGTFLGMLLITIISNSLILLGVPSYWQKVAIGIFILLSVSIPQIVKKYIDKI